MTNDSHDRPRKPRKAKKQPTGDYEVGYCRPPKHNQAQPGEVLNPFGCNGKPKPEVDAFDKAMAHPVPVNDGKKVRADEAMYLKHTALAIGGDQGSFRILTRERKA